jgi:hypothetical protein
MPESIDQSVAENGDRKEVALHGDGSVIGEANDLRYRGVRAECGRRHTDGDGMVSVVAVVLLVSQWLNEALVVVDGCETADLFSPAE